MKTKTKTKMKCFEIPSFSKYIHVHIYKNQIKVNT